MRVHTRAPLAHDNSTHPSMAKTIQTSRKNASAPAKSKSKAPAKSPGKAKAPTKTKAVGKKPIAADTKSDFLTVYLGKGDWLDVMDNEGTWNVAQVIALASDKEVEVKYDGWGEEYNEVVAINSGRVAPFHTYTWAVKCWAKYPNWPWWPSVVTFRPPGNAAGQGYLANETRMFVDFLDHKDIANRCRCWVKRTDIKAFDLSGMPEKRSPAFEASLSRVLQSNAGVEFAPITSGGTLPVKFKTRPAPSTREIKTEIGTRTWVKNMNSSQVRHGKVYSYQPAGIKDDLRLDVEDIDESIFAELADDDWRIDDKPLSQRSTKSTLRNIKTESSTANKRQRLKTETKRELSPSLPSVLEGQILDGPHVPSPRDDDEAEFTAVHDEKAASDAARTSDEDERVVRPPKRLRVQRKRELSPTPDPSIDEPRHTNEVKRSTRKRKAPVLASPVISDEEEPEAPLEERATSSPEAALETVRGERERGFGATTSSPSNTTGEEDSEEVQIEIVLTSDEETLPQDIVDVRGSEIVEGTVHEEDARPEAEETKDSDHIDVYYDDDLGIVDDVAEERDTEDHDERDNDAAKDDDDDDDEARADPLDDWGATRSGGVEGFIQPNEKNSPPRPQEEEEQSPRELSIRPTVEIPEAVATEAVDPSGAVTAGLPVVVSDAVPLPEAEGRAHQGTKPKGRAKKSLLADAESAVLALLREDESQDNGIRPDKPPTTSGGSKTLKTAKKPPAKRPAGEAPAEKSLPKKSATPSPAITSTADSVNGDASHGSVISVQEAVTLQATDSDPGLVRKAGRRFSMRAGVIGHTQMPRGKTPVWVLPPPKYEPQAGEASTQPSVVPTSPVFSSHLSFHSSGEFTIQGWLRTANLRGDYDAWIEAEKESQEEASV